MYFTRSLRLQFSRAYSSVGGGSENAYKILGLQKDCSPEKVRAAFRELAKATHPDTQPGRSEASSSSHFVRVLAAYQIPAKEHFTTLNWQRERKPRTSRNFINGSVTGRETISREENLLINKWTNLRQRETPQITMHASMNLKGRSLYAQRQKLLSG